jgi:hypothetical protein
MGKDGSGNSAGKDTELDALLSAADQGMLDAIRDNLDLDTGLAQILGDLANSHGYARGPAPGCEISGAARKIPDPPGPRTRKEPRDHHKTLTALAFAVIAALNIALLCSLTYSAVGAQSGAIAARGLWYFPSPGPHKLIVLDSKAGASASLRFAADNAGIGGDPVISYLKDSRSGPVLLLAGFPAGTAISFFSTGADRSSRNRSAASHWNHPFSSGGEQFFPGTVICVTGGNGQVMLKTVQNQPSGQIGVLVTWFPYVM